MINRSALIVIAKQPFLDWLHNLPEPIAKEITLEAINQDPTVYLMPEYEDIDEREGLIRKGFRLIFEEELGTWCTDDCDWPEKRSYEVFSEWFQIDYFSVVQDLSAEPLTDD